MAITQLAWIIYLLVLNRLSKVGLPILQIKKKGHFERGGGGYHILLVNFLCEGAPLVKCNGVRRNSIPNLRLPHFYSPQQRNWLNL